MRATVLAAIFLFCAVGIRGDMVFNWSPALRTTLGDTAFNNVLSEFVKLYNVGQGGRR
jgi:hypothetical protein